MLRQRPDLAWYWLAEVEQTDSAAVIDLSRAIALNPQVGEYYQQRCLHYESLRDYTAGIADLQRAVPFFINLGKCAANWPTSTCWPVMTATTKPFGSSASAKCAGPWPSSTRPARTVCRN